MFDCFAWGISCLSGWIPMQPLWNKKNCYRCWQMQHAQTSLFLETSILNFSLVFGHIFQKSSNFTCFLIHPHNTVSPVGCSKWPCRRKRCKESKISSMMSFQNLSLRLIDHIRIHMCACVMCPRIHRDIDVPHTCIWETDHTDPYSLWRYLKLRLSLTASTHLCGSKTITQCAELCCAFVDK